MAKILKPDFNKDCESEWIIMCPECEGTVFELHADLNPETDENWEIVRAICVKCGALICDDNDEDN